MNYSELKAASIAYADRYDKEVDDNVNLYILFTESRVNRLLKVRKQSARAFTPTEESKEYYSLPPDWAGMRSISIVNPNSLESGYSIAKMNLIDPELFEDRKIKGCGGEYFYYVLADQIRVYPLIPTGLSIETVYFQKVPPLTVDNPENWLSVDHPDIYLAGMCAEISLFSKDYDAATGWYERLTTAVGELDNVDWHERWSGDPMVVRLG